MLLASILRAEEPVARRTDRFNATLGPRSTVRIDNISGDVSVTAGREFSAVCNTTVTASTQARADEALANTKILQSRDGDELSLETQWPEMEGHSRRERSTGTWSWKSNRGARCPECRITVKY